MSGFLRLMRAEGRKLRRSPILRLHILVPAAGVLLFLCYGSFAAWNPVSLAGGYLELLACVFPFLSGLICALSCEQEETGGWQTFLLLPEKKFEGLLAKWIVLSLLALPSVFLAAAGFGLCYGGLLGKAAFPFAVYLEAAAVIWAGGLVCYLIQIGTSLCLGKIPAVIAAVVETLFSFLFLTGLGEGKWMFFPWTWSVRWCDAVLLRGEETGGSIAGIGGELAVCAAEAVLVIAAVFVWFRFYEGRRLSE